MARNLFASAPKLSVIAAPTFGRGSNAGLTLPPPNMSWGPRDAMQPKNGNPGASGRWRPGRLAFVVGLAGRLNTYSARCRRTQAAPPLPPFTVEKLCGGKLWKLSFPGVGCVHVSTPALQNYERIRVIVRFVVGIALPPMRLNDWYAALDRAMAPLRGEGAP